MKKLFLTLVFVLALALPGLAQITNAFNGTVDDDGTGWTLRRGIGVLNYNDNFLLARIGTNTTNIASLTTNVAAISVNVSNHTVWISNLSNSIVLADFSNATFYGQTVLTNSGGVPLTLLSDNSQITSWLHANGSTIANMNSAVAFGAGGFDGVLQLWKVVATGPIEADTIVLTTGLNTPSVTVAGITLNASVITNLVNLEQFSSVEYPITTGSIADTNHLLSRIPQTVRWSMVCKTNDLGFVVGDEVDCSQVLGASQSHSAFVFGVNPTNVFISCITSNTLAIRHKTTAVALGVAETKWRVKCTAVLTY